MTKLLSVVVSVYNEELALREFYAETGKILKRLPGNWDYEFLFVNDGSRDQSLSILKEFAASDEKVKIINFSRNFGHEAAMIAGPRPCRRYRHRPHSPALRSSPPHARSSWKN